MTEIQYRKRQSKGNRRFFPTPKERERVRELAALGTPLEDICLLMGLKVGSVGTLKKRYKHELATGALEANATIGGVLFKKACGGDIAAVKLWLSMRGKDQWKEKTSVEVAGPGGGAVQHAHTLDISKLSDEQLKALEPVLAALAGSGTENNS